jgi:hypothetical protein
LPLALRFGADFLLLFFFVAMQLVRRSAPGGCVSGSMGVSPAEAMHLASRPFGSSNSFVSATR